MEIINHTKNDDDYYTWELKKMCDNEQIQDIQTMTYYNYVDDDYEYDSVTYIFVKNSNEINKWILKSQIDDSVYQKTKKEYKKKEKKRKESTGYVEKMLNVNLIKQDSDVIDYVNDRKFASYKVFSIYAFDKNQ